MNDLVKTFLVGRQLAGGQALFDDLSIADEIDDVFVVEKRRGFPAALEDGRRRLIAAHDVDRSTHAGGPPVNEAFTGFPDRPEARAWGSRSRNCRRRRAAASRCRTADNGRSESASTRGGPGVCACGT